MGQLQDELEKVEETLKVGETGSVKPDSKGASKKTTSKKKETVKNSNVLEDAKKLKAKIKKILSNKSDDLFFFAEEGILIEAPKRINNLASGNLIVSIDGIDYGLSAGLYCIIGEADSGKSTLINRFASSKQNKTFFRIGEVFEDSSNEEINIQVRGLVYDLYNLERILEDDNSIIFVDSFDFIMPYNSGFGLEAMGLPKRPFQTLQIFDKICKELSKTVLVTIPVDDGGSLLDRFYNKTKIKTSGVFLCKAQSNSLKFTIRQDTISKTRISDRTVALFEIQNI